MKLIRKDGELIDINLSASLLRNEKGEVIGTLGIYRDICEKNKLFMRGSKTLKNRFEADRD